MQANIKTIGITFAIALICGVLLGSRMNCAPAKTLTVRDTINVPAMVDSTAFVHGKEQYDSLQKVLRRTDTIFRSYVLVDSIHDTIILSTPVKAAAIGSPIHSIAPSPAALMSVFVPPTPRQLFEVWGGINYNLLTSKDGAFVEGDLNLDRIGLFNATLFGEIRLPIEVNLGIKGKLYGGNL
ncbi:hypothetical protein KGP36_01590 [Patescibacteria group bacterium]|nr:hypothetical protein [Patescibacteria group bacterium]